MDHINHEISLSVTLVLLLTASTVVTGQKTSYTARVGDEVTLPCENVIKDQQSSGRTSWLFSRSTGATVVELITDGKIRRNYNSKVHSDRLRVSADCSLVIRNITEEGAGLYTCRQFSASGKQHGEDAQVYLSLVNIEQHGSMLFICSVLTYSGCDYTVNWMYKGDINIQDQTQGTCSESVTFEAPLYQESNSDEWLYCNVTDKRSKQTVLLNLNRTASWKESTPTEKEKISPTNPTNPTNLEWWMYVVVAVGLTALLIILLLLVAFIRRKNAKGNKSQKSGNNGQSLNPAATQPGPDISQEMADPEDGVSYASISYTKKSDHKAQADGVDEGSVTYSTVKMSSPAVDPSADSSSLYATVNKANTKAGT